MTIQVVEVIESDDSLSACTGMTMSLINLRTIDYRDHMGCTNITALSNFTTQNIRMAGWVVIDKKYIIEEDNGLRFYRCAVRCQLKLANPNYSMEYIDIPVQHMDNYPRIFTPAEALERALENQNSHQSTQTSTESAPNYYQNL